MDTFLGQIEIFAWGFTPKGWAPCDGRLLSILANQPLFALLGTTFGGDGRTTFALPDLRGRTPIGQTTDAGRTAYPLGTTTGEETHTLTVGETAFHSHPLVAVGDADLAQNTPIPGSNVGLSTPTAEDGSGNPLVINMYVLDPDPTTPLKQVAMADAAVGIAGGQPHPNLMPYLTLNVCISLQGTMPSRG